MKLELQLSKMRDNHLKWFVHTHYAMQLSAPVRRVIIANGAVDTRGRPKWIWIEGIKKDMLVVNLIERMVL